MASAISDDIRISVVVPVYNGEKYIKRTLDSIFHQTMLPYEVIMVDDGSVDNSSLVIQEYFDTHKKAITQVKLINQKNQGAGAARNTGIKNSTGNWIAFLDSDDIWDENKIKYTYETIKKHPKAMMVSHNMYVVTDDDYESKTYAELHKKYNKKTPLFTQLYYLPFLPTPCVTLKRNLVDKAGLFDISLPSCQDWDMWLKCSLYMNDSDNLVIIDKPLFYYLTRKGSISYNTKKRYECGRIVHMRYKPKLKEYMTKREANKYSRRAMNIFVFGESYNALKQHRILKSIELLLWYSRDLILSKA